MNDIVVAREILANGFCKNQGEDMYGNHCAVGAVAAVNDNSVVKTEIYDILSAVATEMFPDRVPGHPVSFPIIYVNDHEDTTLEDMLTIFDKAAIRLDEQV